ncbi:hypothetical protein C21_02845 [Arenibacter sp. NBRC 103722]|uniref:Uncharacterized protein n=1 Tax=Arenibacter algicola TaxID=616991 RepID=A0A221V1K9_9FLAO|nr:hypothetical protein AREALGSMS7_03837 [Arenibacter algicola]GBF20671.1 hypothetical protein C21_02845 [Arenibacter sp. NBRC 103722]
MLGKPLCSLGVWEIVKKTLLYQQTFQVINKIADFPPFYLRYWQIRINLLKYLIIINNT